MKKTFQLLLLFALVSTAFAPRGYGQRLTPVLSGTLPGAVLRDLTQYPATDPGKAALITAINSGSLGIGARPLDPSIVGRFSYTFSDFRKDFLNRSFITDPAPVLSDAPRTAPRLLGNYYDFPAQTAQNTVLFKRIPPFTAHPSKYIIYPGGLYDTPDDNTAMLSRGWNHTSEGASQNSYAVYPTQFKRAIEMANYAAAYNAAQSLPDSDPRKQKLLDWAGPLPAFEGRHLFIDDEESCKLYALYWYNTLKQADWRGAIVDAMSVNHEIFDIRQGSPYNYEQQWYRQVGWITKEVLRLAQADGTNMVSGMTDFGNLSHLGHYFFDDTDPATGYPRFMSYYTIHEPYRGTSQSAPLGNSTDIGELVRTGKGFAGVGSYIQHTWDEQSMFVKNPNGSYKIGADGGLVWRTDVRHTTITGQETVLYNTDAADGIRKWYNIFSRYGANIYFRAGSKHLPLSTDRQPGFENVRFHRQFRLDGECQGGASPQDFGLTQAEFDMLNSRPLNPDWTEADALSMYLFNDYLRGWGDVRAVSTMGSSAPTKAKAAAEQMTKGFHRASQLNWINDTPWQLVQPKLWIRNQYMTSSPDPQEAYYRKPILMGGIATKDGKPTLWLFGWWPCQDTDRYTDVIVWVNKGGVQSPGYRVRLKGRKAFCDYWTLPDNVAGFQPKDIYFQFSSLLGEKITWQGDYREARITQHPTPPLIQENGYFPTGYAVSNGTNGSTTNNLALKTGYMWNSGAYYVLANRTDTETYRARMTALDGQLNQIPTFVEMEAGSFYDNSHRAWNLRAVAAPVAPGRWTQTVEKKSSGQTVSANVTLASGVDSDAILTTVTTATAATGTSTIGLQARFSYGTAHNGVLQIRAKGTGSGYTLKIERQDGQAMSLLNEDNPVLNSGVFYGYGTVAGEDYNLDWTFWNVPPVPVVLTFNLNGATNSVVITPAVVTNQDLFTGTVTNPGSVTTTNPGSTTSSGATDTTPLAGPIDWSPLPGQSIPADGKVVRENSGMYMRFDLNMGNGRTQQNGLAGGIEILRDKQTGWNNVSNPIYAPGNMGEVGFCNGCFDLGSGLQNTSYRDPRGNWIHEGINPPYNIGDNPIAYGSLNGASSKLNVYGSSTVSGVTTDYFSIDPAQWDGITQPDGLGKRFGDKLENWNRLEGNVLKIWYRDTYNRASGDDTAQDDPSNQEWPCIYTNGLLDRWVFYRGDSPYTNAGVENITLPDNSAFGQGRLFLSENWMANINSQTGRGVGIIGETPEMLYGQFGFRYNNVNATGFGRGYIAWQPKQVLDNGVYRHSVIVVTGTADEIRAAAYQYAQNRRTLMPEVRFNKPGRQNWWFKNVDDGGWQANPSYWSVKWKSTDAHINSPAGAYSGATNKQFSMRYRYSIANSSSPQVRVWFQPVRTADNFRPGNEQGALAQQMWDLKYPAGSAIDPALYSKLFTLNGDGQWHTVTFDMSDMGTWNRILSEIAIWPGGQANVGEQLQIEWISGSASGPTN